MLEHAFITLAQEALALAKNGGVYLTTQDKKVNSMVIGWGQVGVMWGKGVFVAPVRFSRFTFEQLRVGAEFTVSIPSAETKKGLAICGSKSGRDMDKLAAAGLTTQPARTTSVPVIANCAAHIECRVLGMAALDLETLHESEKARFYGDGDTHMLFFGEILACYEED